MSGRDAFWRELYAAIAPAVIAEGMKRMRDVPPGAGRAGSPVREQHEAALRADVARDAARWADALADAAAPVPPASGRIAVCPVPTCATILPVPAAGPGAFTLVQVACPRCGRTSDVDTRPAADR